MKKLSKAIIMVMFCFILMVGVFAIFVKTNTYKSSTGTYQYAPASVVSTKYQNQYLTLRKLDTIDLNKEGLVHIGTVVKYNNETTTFISEVKEYEGNLLVLIDGSKIQSYQVMSVGETTNDFILQTTNILVENQINLIVLICLFVAIIIYYVLSLTKKQPKVITVTQTSKSYINPPVDFNYSEIDKIGLDYVTNHNITFSTDDFGSVESMSVDEISEYCLAKKETIKTPGVGKNPTSFKIKGKKSYLLIYLKDDQTKLTFKTSPIIGQELILKSNGIVVQSSFPHGSVWFSITDIKLISKEQLMNLIDIAYQLASHKV